MLTLLTGFIASVAHVVSGPDHLAAVTPLAIDSRKKSWLIGLLWGTGHSVGMMLIGLLFILFKEVLPVESISMYSDTIIGCLLILIGTWAILRTWKRLRHGHRPHAHPHTHPYRNPHIHLETAPMKKNALTAFLIGIIHGFAGFSHLLALLPSLALPTLLASLTYVIAFATGTILTMITFAFLIGLVAFRSAEKSRLVFLKWLTYSGGALAIAVGIIWIVNPF